MFWPWMEDKISLGCFPGLNQRAEDPEEDTGQTVDELGMAADKDKNTDHRGKVAVVGDS